MTRAPIRSILVVGDGIGGLSAALAFSRALPGVSVSILRVPENSAVMADRIPIALPSVGRFHAAIGLDEIELVRRGVAVHHLGTRFEGGPSDDFIHTFGDVGRGEGAVPFHQIWLAAHQSDGALAFDRYSPASMIGNAGKFVHPANDPTSPLATFLYGLRLHPQRYHGLLEEASKALPRVTGRIATIDRRDDNMIAAVVIDDGRRLEADLYVDCSGPAAILANAIDPRCDDWSQWLPAIHVATELVDGGIAMPLAAISALFDGWRLSAPVPGGVVRVTVTNSPRDQSTAIKPGRRRDAFVANVLTIGDSAVTLDPLHGSNLSLAHDAILRAIALLPGRDCNPLELAEYNRLTALQADRARDYQALFQSSAFPGPALPASLERTLTQWRVRGRLPFFEEEMFTPSGWMQMLLGLGIVPDHVAPSARAIDGAAAATAMTVLARELDELAARLPSYADYLARIGAPQKVSAAAN